MRATIRILGCGSSGGVPQVYGGWGACDSRESRNLRRRCSLLATLPGGRILVDSAPDLRMQLLDAGVDWLDGVIHTHDHADHTHGLDDLRGICLHRRAPLPARADRKTLDSLIHRFPYAFVTDSWTPPTYSVALRPEVIGGPFEMAGTVVRPFVQDHGRSRSLGLRLGSFACANDVVDLDERAFAVLAGVRELVTGCLRYSPHPAHAHLEKALGWIRRIGPERAWLTHMSSDMDYQTLCDMLPPEVRPAYDGLEFAIEAEEAAGEPGEGLD